MDYNQIINAVEYNLNNILNNFKDFKYFSTQNQVLILVSEYIEDILIKQYVNYIFRFLIS